MKKLVVLFLFSSLLISIYLLLNKKDFFKKTRQQDIAIEKTPFSHLVEENIDLHNYKLIKFNSFIFENSGKSTNAYYLNITSQGIIYTKDISNNLDENIKLFILKGTDEGNNTVDIVVAISTNNNILPNWWLYEIIDTDESWEKLPGYVFDTKFLEETFNKGETFKYYFYQKNYNSVPKEYEDMFDSIYSQLNMNTGDIDNYINGSKTSDIILLPYLINHDK